MPEPAAACRHAAPGECDPRACPAYGALRETFEAVRRREVERHAGGPGAPSRPQADALTRRVVERALAAPLARLPQAAAAGEDPRGEKQRREDRWRCPGMLLARLFTPPARDG